MSYLIHNEWVILETSLSRPLVLRRCKHHCCYYYYYHHCRCQHHQLCESGKHCKTAPVGTALWCAPPWSWPSHLFVEKLVDLGFEAPHVYVMHQNISDWLTVLLTACHICIHQKSTTLAYVLEVTVIHSLYVQITYVNPLLSTGAYCILFSLIIINSVTYYKYKYKYTYLLTLLWPKGRTTW